VIGVTVVVVAGLFGRIIGSNLGDSKQVTSDAFVTSEDFEEYVAAEHGFRVSFPGFPTKESETFDLNGYSVPYTNYARDLSGGDHVYAAMVWDYDKVPLGPGGPDLEGSINGMAQNVDGSQIESIKPSSLGGLEGQEGHITASQDGKTYDMYTRVTSREKKMFGVMTIGVAHSQFEAFATSFRFDY
jgi:hypothetical protein